MKSTQKHKNEFGDFQTPALLATQVCNRLTQLGVCPDFIVEPTCGLGAFILAAAETFPKTQQILGFEINPEYVEALRKRIKMASNPNRIQVELADFFSTDWKKKLPSNTGNLLVLGNYPWVTNAGLGSIGGDNLPIKNNFLRHNGLDAITGKANFDISEWMLIETLRWFEGRNGVVAMLVKTAVARKVLAYSQKSKLSLHEASIIKIDARQAFNASVDACLLVMNLDKNIACQSYEYTMYDSLDDTHGRRVGYRNGLAIADLDTYDEVSFLVGESPQKWRSGIKHDASQVMELAFSEAGLTNGKGDQVDIEDTYLYPLLKGSDIGSDKTWRKRYVLITQHFVGERTDIIRKIAPKTWDYLLANKDVLNARASTIYKNNPLFSIFGIGDYAFRPWKIAICSLYKKLKFRLIGPIESRPVMFDDTVYYLSFYTETEAVNVLEKLNSSNSISLLSSLIFWDDKRPIKTSLLNIVDWSRVDSRQFQEPKQMNLF